MGPSRTRTIRIPNDLAEAMEKRAKDLGYKTFNDYCLALPRYDCLVQGKHNVTLPISRLTKDQQDKFDAHMLELTKKGIGQRGQYLKHVLEEMGEVGADVLKALEKMKDRNSEA